MVLNHSCDNVTAVSEMCNVMSRHPSRRRLQVVMVNSSWTQRHVRQLWWKLEEPRRVFPPCNTAALQALPLERKLKRLYLVSVAQFRPEKQHGLQLEALALARSQARHADNCQGAPYALGC